MSTLSVKKVVLNCSNPNVLIRVETVNDPLDPQAEADSGETRDVLLANVENEGRIERVIIQPSDESDLPVAAQFARTLRKTMSLDNLKAQLAALQAPADDTVNG